MAGLGRKVFAPGEVLTATNVQNYLMDQAVQVYAGTAARGSAIGTATTDGMVSYLSDVHSLQMATGTATWTNVDSLPIVAGTATRNALYPSPTQGNTVFRTDKGGPEAYSALYNASTNPGGASAAGWYPGTGLIPAARRLSTTVQSTSGTSGTWTKIAFNVVDFDTWGMTSTADTITAPFAGIYHVRARGSWQYTTSGTFTAIRIYKNGSIIDDSYYWDGLPVNGAAYPYAPINGTIELAAGDALTVYMQSSNGTNILLQKERCYFELIWVCPTRGV